MAAKIEKMKAWIKATKISKAIIAIAIASGNETTKKLTEVSFHKSHTILASEFIWDAVGT